jgi:hypothetical protein
VTKLERKELTMGYFWTATAAAFAACLFAFPAAAQSLKDKLTQQDAEKRLADEHVFPTNTRCGTEIKSGFDWTSFDMKKAEAFSIAGYCSEPLGAVRDLCDNDLGKQAVTSKIKSYVCKMGDERKLTLLPDGTLEYQVDFKSANDYYYAREWLLNNL